MTGVGVLGGMCLVGFGYSNLSADRSRVNSLASQTQDESAVQAQLTKSQTDLEASKSQLTHLEQGIPSSAYVPTMLQDLQKTGQNCGIAVTGVRPMPKAAAPPSSASGDASTSVAKPSYVELDIEVKGNGTYAAAQKFINALQTFPKIVGARTLEITPATDPKEAETGLVNITVGMRAYLFPDDPANAKKDAAPAKTTNATGKEAA
jgi:Tfp pilus assembly protein PilO